MTSNKMDNKKNTDTYILCWGFKETPCQPIVTCQSIDTLSYLTLFIYILTAVRNTRTSKINHTLNDLKFSVNKHQT